jgi:hypothetical protein
MPAIDDLQKSGYLVNLLGYARNTASFVRNTVG